MTAKQGICKSHKCEEINTAYKYFWMSFITSLALVFCTDTHVCTVSKVIVKNEEKDNT